MGWTRTPLYFPFSGLLLGFASLTVALVRPWVVWWHNVLDSIVLASLCAQGVLFYTMEATIQAVDPKYSLSSSFSGVSASLGVVPGIVGAVLVIQLIIPKAIVTCGKRKIRALIILSRKFYVLTWESSPKQNDETTPLISCAN